MSTLVTRRKHTSKQNISLVRQEDIKNVGMQSTIKYTISKQCFHHEQELLNTLRAGVRYIRTSISAYKTAVFGYLANALAPLSIALKSCSTAQMDRPV